MIDDDIAHIARVMRPSLCGFLGGPILPAEYWRKRLHELLDSCHLSKGQLCSIDSLLLQLDQFDAERSAKRNRLQRTASIRRPKTTLPGLEDNRRDTEGKGGRRNSVAALFVVPPDPAMCDDVKAHCRKVVRGPRAITRRSRIPVEAACPAADEIRPGQSATRANIDGSASMPDGHAANEHASPGEGDGRNASILLAAAVHELFADGLAATLNAAGAGNVLLGVRAMTLAQISAFEAWQDGIRQQLEMERFDGTIRTVNEDRMTQP
ncbi:hypothetical protein [Paraburkholderia sp. GAS348]|uniref:hypothetical protein n=1 Tax=Paraburkholderia sp. GAS348 TaxID=3035132 RepID=UPI003D20B244